MRAENGLGIDPEPDQLSEQPIDPQQSPIVGRPWLPGHPFLERDATVASIQAVSEGPLAIRSPFRYILWLK
jgi:hypothetical protein